MRHRREDRLESRLLAAYADGEVTASERDAVEQRLRDSAKTRARLATIEHIRGSLTRPVPEFVNLDLAPGVRKAIASTTPTRNKGGAWSARLWILAAAAAGTVAFAALLRVPEAEPEFRAKSGTEVRERWAGIKAFRLSGTAAPERIGRQVRRSDDLLFSYTNLGAHAYSHLMIFSRDASRTVFWFHPAFESAGTDPSSVTIQRGAANVSLPEVIQHDFRSGPLTIYALFSRRPYRVSEIERWLAAQSGALAAGPDADSHLATLPTRVVP